MLSKNAFNALLKTLEEPPPHVKFIFATTEIRKVPVTVLSRCQRFDLRRVDVDTLKKHFSYVCSSEKVTIDDEALNLIARAADGSVRDGLSLLDQAISMNAGDVSSSSVQSMLGLADRGLILDLYEHIAHGRTTESLSSLAHLYSAGADPASLVQDLLDLTHIMTKFKATDAAPHTVEPNMSANERARASTMATQMNMSVLGRFWTLLLKGMHDVQNAPNGQSALEKLVMRLLYAADLPDPSLLLEKIKQDGGVSSGRGSVRASSGNGGGSSMNAGASVTMMSSGGNGAPHNALPKIEAHAQTAPQMVANNNLNTLQDVVALLEQNGALILASEVFSCVELITLKDTHIECSLTKNASPKLPSDLAKKLSDITNQRWIVSVSNARGAPTLKTEDQARAQELLATIKSHPMVTAVMDEFKGAEIISITDYQS
jgi:DNA polymerase-3 subunit gamma/tau